MSSKQPAPLGTVMREDYEAAFMDAWDRLAGDWKERALTAESDLAAAREALGRIESMMWAAKDEALNGKTASADFIDAQVANAQALARSALPEDGK